LSGEACLWPPRRLTGSSTNGRDVSQPWQDGSSSSARLRTTRDPRSIFPDNSWEIASSYAAMTSKTGE
jgi:hypothetical protein